MKVKPVGNYILVASSTEERFAVEEVKPSGLILPEELQKKQNTYLETRKVLATGPNVKNVEVGEYVVFDGYINPETKHPYFILEVIENEGEEFHMMAEANVLYVLTE